MPSDALHEEEITCPYCGERIAVLLDLSAGDQRYIEDCQVCCRPIELALEIDHDGERLTLTPRRDDE